MANKDGSAYDTMRSKMHIIGSKLKSVIEYFDRGYSFNDKCFCYGYLKSCIAYADIIYNLICEYTRGEKKITFDVDSCLAFAYQYYLHDDNIVSSLKIDFKSFLSGVDELYKVQSLIKECGNILDSNYSDDDFDYKKNIYYKIKEVYQLLNHDFNIIMDKIANARGNLLSEDGGLSYHDYLEAEQKRIETLDIDSIDQKTAQYYVFLKNEWVDTILNNVNAKNSQDYLEQKINSGELAYEEVMELLSSKINNELECLNTLYENGLEAYLTKKNEVLEWYKVYCEFLKKDENITSTTKDSIDEAITDANNIILANEGYVSLLEEQIKVILDNNYIFDHSSKDSAKFYLEQKINSGELTYDEVMYILPKIISSESESLNKTNKDDIISNLAQTNKVLGWSILYYEFLKKDENITADQCDEIDKLLTMLDDSMKSTEGSLGAFNILVSGEQRLSNLDPNSSAYYQAAAQIAGRLDNYFRTLEPKTSMYENLSKRFQAVKKYNLYMQKSKELQEEREQLSTSYYLLKSFWNTSFLVSSAELLKESTDVSSPDYDEVCRNYEKAVSMRSDTYDLYESVRVLNNPRLALTTKDYEAMKYYAIRNIITIRAKYGDTLTEEEKSFLNDYPTVESYKADIHKVTAEAFISGLLDIGENVLDGFLIVGALAPSYLIGQGDNVLSFIERDLSTEYYDKQVEGMNEFVAYGDYYSSAYSFGTFAGSLGLAVLTSGLSSLTNMAWMASTFITANTIGGTYENLKGLGASNADAIHASLISGAISLGISELVISRNLNWLAGNDFTTGQLFAKSVGSFAGGLAMPLAGSIVEYLFVDDVDSWSFNRYLGYADRTNTLKNMLVTGISTGLATFASGVTLNIKTSRYFEELAESDLIVVSNRSFGKMGKDDLITLKAIGTDKTPISYKNWLAIRKTGAFLTGIAGTSYCVEYFKNAVQDDFLNVDFSSDAEKCLDYILTLADDISSGKLLIDNYIKMYDVKNAEYLPRADIYLSDDFIVDYMKTLFPCNELISNVNDVSNLALVLSSDIKETFITFQSADDIDENGKYGNSFAVPLSWLKANVNDYTDCYKFEDDQLVILNYEKFSLEILGTSFGQNEDVYMIETTVPINGENISIPSMLNGTADLSNILPFYQLEDGKTVINPYASISSFAVDLENIGSTCVDTSTGIEYKIQTINNKGGDNYV